MTDFNTDMNLQFPDFQPIELIHEAGATEFYFGLSNNGNDTSKPIWQIKKISKSGDVWATALFPDGNQMFSFIWDERLSYTYV